MELKVVRKYPKINYTIGNLYIDGKLFCNTLEDTDRGLKDSMSITEIKTKKKLHVTAIPTGTYEITLDVVSPKFSKKQFYMDVCSGKLPRLLNVKGFDGILIHVGNGPNGKDLTDGCILIGKNTIKGGLTQGKEYFKNLYTLMSKAKSNGEVIRITIQ